MITIDIQEDNFNKKSTSSYDLSILLGMDSFVYFIGDVQRNVLAYKTYVFEEKEKDFSKLKAPLQAVLLNDKLLKLPYRKIKLSLLHPISTLIPNALYDENQKVAYLDKLTKLSDDDIIKVDELADLEMKNVYLVNKDITKLIRSYFPNAKFFHSTSALLLGLKKYVQHTNGQMIFGNVRDKTIQIIYFDGNNLVFSNRFEFHSAKDFIYYVMNVYDQFNLKPETVPFVISGEVVAESEIYHLLYRYIRNLKMIKLPGAYQFGTQMKGHNQHFYFDLLSLDLCE